MHLGSQSIEVSINQSKKDGKALAGAVLGLLGSPSYEKMNADAEAASKMLSDAERNIRTVIKIVEESQKPAEITSPPKIAEQSFSIHSTLLASSYSRDSYKDFL